MGKASRKKAGRRGVNTSPFLTGMSEPLDPEVFQMMVKIYQAAASFSMPTPNPAETKIHCTDTGQTFELGDNSLNRGMLAVNRQCREIGVANPQGYVARLMHMSEIFEARERFGGLIVAGTDGEFSIHSSVFEAAATAKFHASTDRMGFDLDDVIAKAQALAQAS